MKLHIFAIRDRATDQYGNPMFMINKGQATRSFIDEINKKDEQNQLNKHPDDFDLYHLGEYDTDTGTLTPNTPKMIIAGKECYAK